VRAEESGGERCAGARAERTRPARGLLGRAKAGPLGAAGHWVGLVEFGFGLGLVFLFYSISFLFSISNSNKV